MGLGPKSLLLLSQKDRFFGAMHLNSKNPRITNWPAKGLKTVSFFFFFVFFLFIVQRNRNMIVWGTATLCSGFWGDLIIFSVSMEMVSGAYVVVDFLMVEHFHTYITKCTIVFLRVDMAKD